MAWLDVTVLHVQSHSSTGIGFAWRVPKHNDFGVHRLDRYLEEANGAESQVFVVWEGGATAVQDDDAVPLFQHLVMRVARDHDVHRCGEELLQLVYRSEAAFEAVHHADAPAVHVQDLDVFTAGIHNRIVVTDRTQDRGELFQPVQDHGRGQVPAMQDEIHAEEKRGRFWAEFIELADEIG